MNPTPPNTGGNPGWRGQVARSRRIADVEAVLARRRDNGGDYWASTRYREVLKNLGR